jgi:hypothetical protein
MSGSDSKSTQEADASSPNETTPASLADFLASPRPRGSLPAPAEASATPAMTVDRASTPVVDELDAASQDSSTAVTPIEPTTLNDLPVARAAVKPAEATTLNDLPVARARAAEATSAEATSAEARPSVAPISKSDASARSLIPVATGSSDAPGDDEVDDDFHLPGAGAPWSSAAVRRATFVALLAAAAAVPAWVVFRARTVDVSAHADVSAQKAAPISAAPTTLEPTR